MSSAKLTLIGMYDYDNTIFSELVMPEGIDKDLFIQALLIQGGEFEVLYPQPAFMKYSIKVWSSKWFRTFSEWLRGTQQKWNPIFNYDRFESTRDESLKEFNSLTKADYSDNRKVDLDDTRTADLTEKRTADLEDKRIADLEDKRTADLRDVRTDDLTDKRTADLKEKTTFDNTDTTTQTDDMTTEHKVAAYDSGSYSPSSQDTVNNGQSKIDHTGNVTNGTTGTDTTDHTGTEINDHTGTDTMKYSGSDTMTHTGTDTTAQTGTDTMKHTGTDNMSRKGTLSDNSGNEQNTGIHEAHMYGNIGITSSSSMLKEFYDIASWNLYEHMCDVFISELLIPVY